MNKLDLTKPVQTKEGRPARIICTDKKGRHTEPLVVLIEFEEGEICHSYMADGRPVWQGEEYTLVNVPEVRKEYRIVSPKGNQYAITFDCLERAVSHTTRFRNQAANLGGFMETVFVDDKITQINFIPLTRSEE